MQPDPSCMFADRCLCEKTMAETSPKAFISYSWSSPGHCDLIRSYAERLVNDGVDILLDQWDLSEGQDKYAFMEKMVTDPAVSHVIIFSDEAYAEKADQRRSGVGTESQIISKEVYEKVDQRKFIPVVCQRRDDSEPFLPVFLQSRVWIDFSTAESTNQNWEKLLRALYGKPIHEKPSLGKPPSYLTNDEGRPALPSIGKFNSLRTALLESKPSVPFCRSDFLDAAIGYADGLRIREQSDINELDERVLADLRSLLPLRDQVIDWLLIETSISGQKAETALVDFLERVLALKYKPAEVSSWNDWWFDAHRVFVYEIFLYVIAVLIRSDLADTVHELVTTHYLLPDSESRRGLVTFQEFWTHSEVLDDRNRRLQLARLSPIADLIKERATRSDIPFRDVMQAEVVLMLVAAISDAEQWYPHTLVYSGYLGARFPLFIRSARHKDFAKLSSITGVSSGDELRQRFKEGCERVGVNRWTKLVFDADVSFWHCMNMDELDTIK
jgi:SEFIR domain-containing protein